MSANKCARCDLTVYPVEGLRCLDKLWHKGCFKCYECNMTLNLKNYKGFEKRPYCNAHCPQAKATTVADTPESRRLAENTRIQSQAKYHEDFEKSKGKGFTAIADDPETLRIKNTSKIISNVAYHGELERKKQMEERRGSKGHPDEVYLNNNNNNNNNNITNLQSKQQNRNLQNQDQVSHLQVNNYPDQLHQQQLQIQKQQQKLQKQQLLKQQQQLQYVQEARHSQQFIDVPQQQTNKLLPMNNPHLTQQQQLSARQQQQLMLQQQQLQHQHHHQQQQHQRHSMDSSMPMNRHQQAMSNNNSHPQQMIKNQMIPVHHNQHQQQQPQLKYMPMKDFVVNNQSPNQMLFAAAAAGQPRQHMMSPTNAGAMQNAHRISLPNQAMMSQQQMLRAYNPQQQVAIGQQQMNGMIAKQQQQQQLIGQPQARQIIHPNQVPAMNIINVPQQHIRNPQQMQQMPRRVFRAMYDYVANDVDEVSFYENDILVDCVNVDGNWLVGKVARSGQTGMLPANYVVECG